MAAIPAFHSGKAVVQDTAIKIAVNDLFQIGSENTIFPPGDLMTLGGGIRQVYGFI